MEHLNLQEQFEKCCESNDVELRQSFLNSISLEDKAGFVDNVIYEKENESAKSKTLMAVFNSYSVTLLDKPSPVKIVVYPLSFSSQKVSLDYFKSCLIDHEGKHAENHFKHPDFFDTNLEEFLFTKLLRIPEHRDLFVESIRKGSEDVLSGLVNNLFHYLEQKKVVSKLEDPTESIKHNLAWKLEHVVENWDNLFDSVLASIHKDDRFFQYKIDRMKPFTEYDVLYILSVAYNRRLTVKDYASEVSADSYQLEQILGGKRKISRSERDSVRIRLVCRSAWLATSYFSGGKVLLPKERKLIHRIGKNAFEMLCDDSTFIWGVAEKNLKHLYKPFKVFYELTRE
jgi:hypothetical protein